MIDVVILGSTGSIGTQAIELVLDHPDQFRVVGLSAGGSQIERLANQINLIHPARVAIPTQAAADKLRRTLDTYMPTLLVGPTASCDLSRAGADVVLNAITGVAGLEPTLATLQAGSRLALANKESLVVGGELVTGMAQPGQIVPVDSEHSAIAQALRSGQPQEVRRLILTASGGPFHGRSKDQLQDVSLDQALAHPTWSMGRVVTINSATMVNKGLELIEAGLLFGVDWDCIEVVIHPQSIIHSMVVFSDGSTIAQCSPPNMRLPIGVALGWPNRLDDNLDACDFSQPTSWTFTPLDCVTFPAVELARLAGRLGQTVPAVFNAANEVCVDRFCRAEISFGTIVDTVEEIVGTYVDQHLDEAITGSTMTLDDIRRADSWARRAAESIKETA